MNRRGFLKAFAAAAVGAAVAPAIAEIAPSLAPVNLAKARQLGNSITYAMLEEAYTKMSNRDMYPNYAVCSRRQYETLRRLMNAET